MLAEERYSHRISAAQDWILKSMNGMVAPLVEGKIYPSKKPIYARNAPISYRDL